MVVSRTKALIGLLPYSFTLGLGLFFIGRFQPTVIGDPLAWTAWITYWSLILLIVNRRMIRPSLTKISSAALLMLWLLSWKLSSHAQIWQFAWLSYTLLVAPIAKQTWLGGMRLNHSIWGEGLRWSLLSITALVLIHPYATSSLVGGGDAHLYAQILSDFLEQFRTGICPVLVGQSAYAFNGEIHPLRTAPGFFYLGGIFDLLTLRSLSAIAVQNLMITINALLAALITYYSLIRLVPRQGWTAWLLTLLFISSPGVLAPIYSGDMVATWMTLPWLPWLVFSLSRMVDQPHILRWPIQVAVGLAALWLCHAPIAFWVTVCAVPYVAWYLITTWNVPGHWIKSAGLLGLFGLLAGFVFVSVSTLDIPASPNLRADVNNGAIQVTLNQAWLGFFRPVSPSATNLLHDLQLSPGLWIAMLIGLFSLGRVAKVSHRLLAIIIVGLIVLLLPPVAPVWGLMPDIVLNATEKWPTQRFFIILSAMVPFLAFPAIAHYRKNHPLFVRDLSIILLLAGAWSLAESVKFIRRGWNITLPVALTQQQMLPENTRLPRYSYEYYGRLPRYHSHGLTNAWSQTRLLAQDTLEPILSNASWLLSNLPPKGILDFEYTVTDFGGHFSPTLSVSPNNQYLLHFDFQGAQPSGALQLFGHSLWAEYALPDSGEERAFGAGPGRDHTITLGSASGSTDEIDIKFIRAPGHPKTTPFPKLQAVPYDHELLPLQITKLIPFRLTVHSEAPAWLESPKIYVPGYRAEVNNHPVPVALSPDGLVMIPVPAGVSQVELGYPGSFVLKVTFWLGTISWLSLVIFGSTSSRHWRMFHLPPVEVILDRLGKLSLVVALCSGVMIGAMLTWNKVRSEPDKFQHDGVLALISHFPVGNPRGTIESIITLNHPPVDGTLYVNCVDGKQASIGYAAKGKPSVFGDAFPVNYLAAQHITIHLGQEITPSFQVRVNERLVFTWPVTEL